MATANFVKDQTVIEADWLNDVDYMLYTVLGWEANFGEGATIADGEMLVGDGTRFVIESGNTLADSILGDIGGDLRTLGAPASDGQFIVATGAGAFAYESGATARTSLGLVIGTDVQAWDAQLDDIAALAVTDSNFIVGNGTNWIAESGATVRTSLGLAIGTNVQAWDAQLDDIAALTPTKGDLIVGNGTNWVEVAVGATDGFTLQVSAAAASGVAWAANVLDINGQTEQTDPTPNADFGVIYDAGLAANRKVLLGNLSSAVHDTAVTASGTSVNFTGIPSWVRKITVIFQAVSLSGTDSILVQIGDSEGLETTGYSSTSNQMDDAGATAGTNSTAGFVVLAGSAAYELVGHMTLTLLTGTTWVTSHGFKVNTTISGVGAGDKSLSLTLDRLSIVPTGANTFDSGTINIRYER